MLKILAALLYWLIAASLVQSFDEVVYSYENFGDDTVMQLFPKPNYYVQFLSKLGEAFKKTLEKLIKDHNQDFLNFMTEVYEIEKSEMDSPDEVNPINDFANFWNSDRSSRALTFINNLTELENKLKRISSLNCSLLHEESRHDRYVCDDNTKQFYSRQWKIIYYRCFGDGNSSNLLTEDSCVGEEFKKYFSTLARNKNPEYWQEDFNIWTKLNAAFSLELSVKNVTCVNYDIIKRFMHKIFYIEKYLKLMSGNPRLRISQSSFLPFWRGSFSLRALDYIVSLKKLKQKVNVLDSMDCNRLWKPLENRNYPCDDLKEQYYNGLREIYNRCSAVDYFRNTLNSEDNCVVNTFKGHLQYLLGDCDGKLTSKDFDIDWTDDPEQYQEEFWGKISAYLSLWLTTNDETHKHDFLSFMEATYESEKFAMLRMNVDPIPKNKAEAVTDFINFWKSKVGFHAIEFTVNFQKLQQKRKQLLSTDCNVLYVEESFRSRCEKRKSSYSEQWRKILALCTGVDNSNPDSQDSCVVKQFKLFFGF